MTRCRTHSRAPLPEGLGLHSLSDTEQPAGTAGLAVLRGLPPEVEALVSRAFVPMHFEFGETIFSQGDPADAFYLLSAGTARVVVDGEDGQEVSLNLLHSGAAFGEVGLVEGAPRAAT